MDSMQIIDLWLATQYLEYAEVAQWTQTRQMMLCQLKPYLKKKDLTAAELFPLPIDEKEELTKEVSNEDVEWWKNYTRNYKKDSN